MGGHPITLTKSVLVQFKMHFSKIRHIGISAQFWMWHQKKTKARHRTILVTSPNNKDPKVLLCIWMTLLPMKVNVMLFICDIPQNVVINRHSCAAELQIKARADSQLRELSYQKQRLIKALEPCNPWSHGNGRKAGLILKKTIHLVL